MPDYGGRRDGRCEFSFFRRCKRPSAFRVTYGQFGGWTYDYCREHKELVMAENAEAKCEDLDT